MSAESRGRMISFRLSAEEYDKFRKLCLTQGVRSVSEMARAAINILIREPARVQQETLEYRLAELEGRLQSLALELRELQTAALFFAKRNSDDLR